MLQYLYHSLIRQRAKMGALPVSRFSIRSAKTDDDYAQAFNLVQVAYAQMGIEQPGRLFRMTEQHVLPQAHVLLAREGSRVVGTITVTLDSEAGLPLGKDFPQMLAGLRGPERRLAEIGSFAAIGPSRKTGVALLLGIAAARLVWELGSTHTVIGVHPKASAVYQAIMGFVPHGDPRTHDDLHAPVAALCVEREEQRAHLNRFGGRHRESHRTIEDFVFGKAGIPNTNIVSYKAAEAKRMSRETFRRLFIEQSDRVATLSPRTRKYLASLRTDETLATSKPPQAKLRLVG